MDILLTFDEPDDQVYPTGQRARSRPTLLAALIILIVRSGDLVCQCDKGGSKIVHLDKVKQGTFI